MIWTFPGRMGVVLGLVGLSGCVGQHTDVRSEQVYLGQGIVEGTKGYQQIQHEHVPSGPSILQVQGQVLEIEGGAYRIRHRSGREMRLPLDENTRIDRPAHVGDWVEGYLDEGGRAVFVRNIDGRVSLE